MKTAIITGVTGQDGFYLANHLLGMGYSVIGVDRRTSIPTDERLRSLRGNPSFSVANGDVTDLSSIQEIVRKFNPSEFYHLAAQSHVGNSWDTPVSTCDITGMGTLNCLEALRKFKPSCRFYFAGSSEQFGNSSKGKNYLNEESEMSPESPYAAAKVFGYNITQVYRRSYDMFASCGILFNHESPIRGEQFVTRKITKQLAEIYWGKRDFLELGNIHSYRDWGFAGDYVKGMHSILQHDTPDDFVLATGRSKSVEFFLKEALQCFSLNMGVVKLNPDLVRPKDVDVLLGDSTKAKNILGWKNEMSVEGLVRIMCEYDYHAQSVDANKRILAESFVVPGGKK